MTTQRRYEIPLDDGETLVVYADAKSAAYAAATAVQDVIDRTRQLFCPSVSDAPTTGPHPGRTYPCGMRRGHNGPHRWPADTGRLATWEEPTDA